MIYTWFFNLSSDFPIFNVFQYITFRSFLAFFTAFFVCWFVGGFFISRATKDARLGENINTDGPSSHQRKKGTPTMGGSFMLFGLLSVCILWVNFLNPLVLATIAIVYGFALLGLWDDILKLKKKNFRGIPARWRFFVEIGFSFLVLYLLGHHNIITTELHFPFFKDFTLDLGMFYFLFGAFVITGCANAVNLTDGLDGLAVFPVVVCAAALSVFTYSTGHFEIAHYLNLPYIYGSGELTVLGSAVVACGLGFLWYNSYPAQVFMGDVGALGLGSFLGILAVLTKNELLLVILGGLFVVEALSVIFQVLSYQLTGKRIFKMAPIHHHFELKGVSESKIIIRFWIISILLAVISFATLKIR